METFSINGAANILEKDRRTLVRALHYTKPDAHLGRHPRWRMTTILDALAARAQPLAGGQNAGKSNCEIQQLIDEMEADFKTFDIGFAKLEAEPDLERRRALDEKLGVARLFGTIDRKMKAINRAIGEGQGLGALVGGMLLSDMFAKILGILDFQLDPEEVAKIKAEAEARRAKALKRA